MNTKIERLLIMKTTKELIKYAEKKLPREVALSINKEHHIKPYAENGEKYTIWFVNSYSAIAHAETIQEAQEMSDEYLSSKN